MVDRVTYSVQLLTHSKMINVIPAG